MDQDYTPSTTTIPLQRVQIEAPANVLKASPGDKLRVATSMHPGAGKLHMVQAAELAAATTADRLMEAAREHQASLVRLAKQRAQLGATAAPVPDVNELAGDRLQAPDEYLGRVTQRERLTHLTKTSGVLTLDCGESLPWTASASYVDAIEALFDGAPIIALGPINAKGVLSIQEVRCAPVSFWRDSEAEAYEQLVNLNQHHVTVLTKLKKTLAGQNRCVCQVCGNGFANVTHAAVAELVEGTKSLVCRPCKQDWKAVGRQTVGTVA